MRHLILSQKGVSRISDTVNWHGQLSFIAHLFTLLTLIFAMKINQQPLIALMIDPAPSIKQSLTLLGSTGWSYDMSGSGEPAPSSNPSSDAYGLGELRQVAQPLRASSSSVARRSSYLAGLLGWVWWRNACARNNVSDTRLDWHPRRQLSGQIQESHCTSCMCCSPSLHKSWGQYFPWIISVALLFLMRNLICMSFPKFRHHRN